MKNKYSFEAFALSVALFSGAHGKTANLSLKDALIVGVLIVVCAALAAVIRKNDDKANKLTAAIICTFAFWGLAFGAYKFAGLYTDWLTYLKFLSVACICGRAAYNMNSEDSPADTVWKASMAYGMFLIIAALREFISYGSIFEVALTEGVLISAAYAKISFGLIFAGCFTALANAATKSESENCGEYVSNQVIIVELFASTITIGAFSPSVIPAYALALLVLAAAVSIKGRNVFSAAPKALRAMPINLAGLGIAYMVLANVSNLL